MKNNYAKKLFLIAFLLLAGTNLIVLLGIYTNRSGEPETQLILTERELQLPYQISDENSGLSLNIIWRSLGDKNDLYRFTNWRTPAWLDEEKLKSLGFDIDTYAQKKYEDYYAFSTTKEGFIVLEYNAKTYNRHLKEALEAVKVQEITLQSDPKNESIQKLYKQAKERVEAIENYDTRLYAIDAGTNPQILKEKYPESSKYIITKAQIRVSYTSSSKEIHGYISRLSVHSVHVPKKFRQVLAPILQYTQREGTSFRRYDNLKPHPPRYKVILAYGKRNEPWIVSIEPFKK